MKNKMIIVLFLLALVSLGFNFYQLNINSDLDKTNENSSIYEYLQSLPENILNKKIDSGEEFVLFIGRPDCSDCNFFEPTFIKMIEQYNLSEKIYYLNVYKLSKDKDSYENFKNKYLYSQVPCFLYFKNGQVESKIEWTEKGLTESQLKEWLVKNKII